MLHHPTCCPQATPLPPLSIALPLTAECTLNQGRFSFETQTKTCTECVILGRRALSFHWKTPTVKFSLFLLIILFWVGKYFALTSFSTEEEEVSFASTSLSSFSFLFFLPHSPSWHPSLTGNLWCWGRWCLACTKDEESCWYLLGNCVIFEEPEPTWIKSQLKHCPSANWDWSNKGLYFHMRFLKSPPVMLTVSNQLFSDIFQTKLNQVVCLQPAHHLWGNLCRCWINNGSKRRTGGTRAAG